MYRLWSEWDIGETSVIFASKESAMRWLKNHAEMLSLAQLDGCSIDEYLKSCFDHNYLALVSVQIVE
jgi:hypothetical protein